MLGEKGIGTAISFKPIQKAIPLLASFGKRGVERFTKFSSHAHEPVQAYLDIVRIFDEQFRMPDAHLGYQALGLTRGQWLSVAMGVVGVGLAIWWSRRNVGRIGGWGRAGVTVEPVDDGDRDSDSDSGPPTDSARP